MKPIAICENKRIFDHYSCWSSRFIEYAKKNGIPYEVVNCYSNSFIRKIDNYSALIWAYQIYVISDKLEAQNIIKVAETKGLKTFPSTDGNYHFDDKIAEMYAFQSVNAPIPKSWVFYLEKECFYWLKYKANYPIVAKLRCGSGSNNVKILHNADEGIKYAKRMFSKGFNPTPSLGYKAYSKLQSSRDLKTIIKRVKKIPQFLTTRSHASMMPIEKGYCYFQEFIPNEGYDLKVVVINDKLTFCARNVRKNDFRASGGGDCYYDKSLITDKIIDIAFKTARDLKMNCVGFDFVVDERNNSPKIIEMCYGFDYEVQHDLGGYFDKNHQWHNGAVYVPDEIINAIVDEVNKK